MGKPKKYKTPDDLQKAIDSFFKQEDKPTITGLALHLGFTSRADLINYEGYGEEYHYSIKRAKLMVENSYEKDLRKSGRAGDIFALKNFGWRDQQEIQHSGDITHKIINWKPAQKK